MTPTYRCLEHGTFLTAASPRCLSPGCPGRKMYWTVRRQRTFSTLLSAMGQLHLLPAEVLLEIVARPKYYPGVTPKSMAEAIVLFRKWGPIDA